MNINKILIGAFLVFVLSSVGVFVTFLPKELESTIVTAQVTNLEKTDRYKHNKGTIYIRDLTNNKDAEIHIYRKRKIYFPEFKEIENKTFQTTRRIVQYYNGEIEETYPSVYCDISRTWNLK